MSGMRVSEGLSLSSLNELYLSKKLLIPAKHWSQFQYPQIFYLFIKSVHSFFFPVIQRRELNSDVFYKTVLEGKIYIFYLQCPSHPHAVFWFPFFNGRVFFISYFCQSTKGDTYQLLSKQVIAWRYPNKTLQI